MRSRVFHVHRLYARIDWTILGALDKSQIKYVGKLWHEENSAKAAQIIGLKAFKHRKSAQIMV